jgi:hypothetical protein
MEKSSKEEEEEADIQKLSDLCNFIWIH